MKESPYTRFRKVATSQYMGIYMLNEPAFGARLGIDRYATQTNVSIFIRFAYFVWSGN